MKYALDSGVLSILCYKRHPEHIKAQEWLESLPESDDVYVPAIVSYEVKRKLLHLAKQAGTSTTNSLTRLDALQGALQVITIKDETLTEAAELWAIARTRGYPTAGPDALDGDVLIAAQAISVGATVITDNRRHLSRYCPVANWRELAEPTAAAPLGSN